MNPALVARLLEEDPMGKLFAAAERAVQPFRDYLRAGVSLGLPRRSRKRGSPRRCAPS